MGSPVTRLGDICTGHGCFPSRPNVAASSDVFTNGIGTHRVGDSWAVHGCSNCTPHGGVTASGSGSVFVNGRPCARIGDGVSCGSSIAAGSGNVFAG